MDAIVDLLRQELIPTQELRQADAVSRFFEQDVCSRRSGQSIHVFNSYFLAEVQKFRDEGIKTDHLLLGWWWMKRAKPTGERRERLVGMLASRDGDAPSYDHLPTFMSAGARLFSDLHKYERQYGAMSSSATRQASRPTSTFKQAGNKKNVHMAEGVESEVSETPRDEISEEADEEEDELCSQMKTEATQLLEELKEMNPEEAGAQAETAETLAVAADALDSLRALRLRGKGKGKGGSPASKPKMKSKGNHSGGGRSKDLQARKAASACRACGEKGHWAGDPECKANKADTLAIGHEDHDEEHQVLAVATDILE